ncbi:glycosyltransferase [Candidatus Saccharibacteria bacterium]|nr:glycosyltransferase [Candidatus Saccharibacteria bacterium]
MTKKVALTTWWHYRNYGTALQVVALSNTLKSEGYNVDIINYIPHGKRYPTGAKADDATDYGTAERIVDKKRDAKFDDFIKNQLSFTHSCVDDDDFDKLNSKYDAFITGSDQIWSPIVFDSRYFLDFVEDNRKKISYAPSFGVTSIDNEHVRNNMTSLISQFAHLSAREAHGAKLIHDLTQKEASIVLDPTFLLDYSEWRKVIKQNKRSSGDKYILCYFLGENENAWNHVDRIAKEQKLPIKIVPIFSKDANYGEFQLGAGPEEFFNLIDDAEIVLTDSFHGAIFSIICSKPFYVFDRFKSDDKLSQNSRVHNLLELVNLRDRLIGYDEPVRKKYTFDVHLGNAHRAIEAGRKKSIKYLNNSLRIDSPLVSVLLPAYNVEKYIAECLDSIIAQTYQNIEIIIVDDGTPDKAGEIADEYAKKDSRIMVIHKENGGLSTARNVGLDNAKGEYVIFVDSDDIIAPTFVEYMVGLIENMNTNIGASLYCYDEYNDDKPIENDHFQLWPPEKAIEGIYAWFFRESVWNKIYRRSLIEENKLRFRTELLSAEGMTFNIMTFQHSGPVAVGLKKLYLQRFNPDSATRSTDIRRWETCFDAYAYQKKHSKIMNNRIKRAFNCHVWHNHAAIARMIYKKGEEEKYAKYLKKYKRSIRTGIFSALVADVPRQTKIQFVKMFINPKKELSKITEKEIEHVKNNKFITVEKLPWEAERAKPKKRVGSNPEVERLEAENDRLATELASFLSIKRSARLLAGNIKRRIRYGRTRQ